MVALTLQVALWKSENLQSLEQEVKWSLDVVVDVIVINAHLHEVLIWVSDYEVLEPSREELHDCSLGLLLVQLIILEQLF